MNEVNQVEERIEIAPRYIKAIRYVFGQYTGRMSEGREFDKEKLVGIIQKTFDFSKDEAMEVINFAESRYEPTLTLRTEELNETKEKMEEILNEINRLESESKENIETIEQTKDCKLMKRQHSLKKQLYKQRTKLDELKKIEKDLEEQITTKNLKIDI